MAQRTHSGRRAKSFEVATTVAAAVPLIACVHVVVDSVAEAAAAAWVGKEWGLLCRFRIAALLLQQQQARGELKEHSAGRDAAAAAAGASFSLGPAVVFAAAAAADHGHLTNGLLPPLRIDRNG